MNSMKTWGVFLFVCLMGFVGITQNYPYRSDVLWVTTPSHNNWLYKVNEEAKVEVSVYLYGILQENITINYSVGPEMLEADKKGSVAIKNGKGIVSLGTSKIPGFRDCWLSADINGETFKHHIKVGFDPDKLKPYTKMPKDFEAFWETAKQEAAKCPMTIERKFVAEYSNEVLDCYLVKIQAYKKGHYVYGYLTIPKKEGKFPVVFSPPGAGIKPTDPLKHLFYAENDVMRFDMEIHGIRPDLDKDVYKEISQAFGNGNTSYLVNGIEDKNSYYMKKVYLSCIRVLDYLTTLPQWDGHNLIAQGGSQGAALALVTTGLDNRITACAANHPALSDMLGYKDQRAGGYPHLFSKFDNLDTEAVLNTVPYFDVVNFAKRIKVPVFMTWGYNDNVCPPTTSYIVYNVLNTKKEALITPVNEHWVSEDTRRIILKWIKGQLN